MRTITTDIYEALALWYADDTRWLLEDLHHPGTICVCSEAEIPGDCHWQIVSPEELEARRDDLEDEQVRQDEARQCAQQAWEDSEAERLWQERR